MKFYCNLRRWAGHVARMREERGVYRVLVGKPEGKRPMGRPRRRWVDNIRMDLQEVGCGYMDWIGLAQDRDRWRTLVSLVINLRVPWNAGNFLTICKQVSFLRRTLHHGVSKYCNLRHVLAPEQIIRKGCSPAAHVGTLRKFKLYILKEVTVISHLYHCILYITVYPINCAFEGAVNLYDFITSGIDKGMSI